MPARENIVIHRTCLRSAALAALLCGLLAFASPALGAEPPAIEVNSTGDAATITACATAITTDECTLRGAIEVANFTPVADTIVFDPTVFEGVVGQDEIELTSALPALVYPVSIEGPRCTGTYGSQPCVGLVSEGSMGLEVKSAEVEIKNLAIRSVLFNIFAEGAPGLVVTGNWLGLNLNGVETTPAAFGGILVAPGSDGATIGSAAGTPESRNVVGGVTIGAYVVGDSHVKVEGNYIGVRPDGVTPSPPAYIGVKIVDAENPVAVAEDDEIGGVLSASQAATPACDGPCNVISGLEKGIDLTGIRSDQVTPATGPTRIRGNYIGLGADGSTLIPASRWGVYATSPEASSNPGPGHVTVGGVAPTETNFIDGGEKAVLAEHAQGLRVLGNAIGWNANGEPGESPQEIGVLVFSEGVTEPAEIGGNRMLLGVDAEGVVNFSVGARIIGNAIEGSHTSIAVVEPNGGEGSLIEGNTLVGADVDALFLGNEANEVLGNDIAEAGKRGIVVEGGAVENRIGGDLPAEENTLDDNGEPGEPESGAMVVFGEPTDFNEIRGNHGSGNIGPFIQLIGPSATETPNGEIRPPVITESLQSSASGTAEPGATVRVFTKATTDLGELQPEIALATADASGHWTATYPTQPLGTLVAATQTLNGGTSEVSAPVAALSDPSFEPEKKSPETSQSSSSTTTTQPSPPPAPTATPPTVKITKGPAKSSKSTKATFRFTASEPGAKFECKLDGKKWAACRSPKTYKGLKPGRHTFKVRATANGLTGPAKKTQFTIKP